MVPATSGSTPNRWLANRGVHSVPVRKSRTGTSRRNSNVSKARTKMIPPVVSTDRAAHRKSSRSMIHSSVRVVMSEVLLSGAVRELLEAGRIAPGAQAHVVHFAHQLVRVLQIE